MTRDDAVAAYSTLSDEKQIAVLTKYGFLITVCARETYVPQTEDVAFPSQLRQANELLHRVLAHICHARLYIFLLNVDLRKST